MRKMKINKILKRILIILVIIILSIISFLGIYIKDKNKTKNLVKDFDLGMDLKGARRIELNVNKDSEVINYDSEGNVIDSSDKETTVDRTENVPNNLESVLTTENYKIVKKILEARLETMSVSNYEIRVNETDGKIIIDIPENENTDSVVSQLQYQGKFEIIDKDTEEVLMTNDDLESVKAGYGSTSSGYTSIYVAIQFNKEGTQKFKGITNTYVETTVVKDETDQESDEEVIQSEEQIEEEEDIEDETITKEISIKVDGQVLLSTHFDDEISNGLLQLSVGASSSDTTVEELQENLSTANNMSAVLNNGMMPIIYDVGLNQYVSSEIESDNIDMFISFAIVLLTAGMIYLIVKYKEEGIYSSIALIGYIAILLLTIRYTNIVVTISGLVAIILSILVTYLSMIKILKYNVKIDDKKDAFKRAMIKNALIIIPVAILSIVFTFNAWLPVYSFGMTMFWGIIINILYNLIFTKKLIIDSKN